MTRRLVAAPLLALALAGCSWFTDFKQQPKMDPWESPSDTIAMRGNPQLSVPIYGSVTPGFAYGRAAAIATLDSMAGIANPTAADERSLNNGRILFSHNCAVCHGDRGAGDGPVTKFGYPPIAIGAGSNAAGNLRDGYIFAIIRNGRGLMPSYNRIEEADRWDVVNYLRALQSGANVPVGAPAPPGITGPYVPRSTVAAPTRPVPYYRSAAPTTGGSDTSAAGTRVPAQGAAPRADTTRADTAATRPTAR